MVFDDHDVSHLEVLIESSCSISQDHCLYTEQLKYPHGQSDLGQQTWQLLHCSDKKTLDTHQSKH